MSHLPFKSYKGVGEHNFEVYGYSQSVRVGDVLYISGQGGWETETIPLTFKRGQPAQIQQAFKNIEVALKDAGGSGWDQVFKVVSYHVPLTEEALITIKTCFERYMPTHKPLWTCVEVSKLGDPGMEVEIEVIAHVKVSSA